MADVLDAKFQHGNSLNTHTEGKAGILFRVDPAQVEYVGVDHTAAQDFEPAGVFTNVAAFATTNGAAHIHLGRWFGEREIRRAQADLGFLTEQLAREIEQGLFQVGKRHVFVYIKSFNLMENAVGTGRNGFVAEHAAGENSPNWRLGFFHHPNLNARCVGAQQHIRVFADKKGILHVARRVLGRKVQRREHVPVVLNLRPFGNGKSQTGKNFDDFIPNNRKWVPGAGFHGLGRHGQVNCSCLLAGIFEIFF